MEGEYSSDHTMHKIMADALFYGNMIENFHVILLRAIKNRIWEKLPCRATGRNFNSLLEYVTHPQPDGLQSSPERIEQVISHNAEALTAWRGEVVRGRGGDRRSENFKNDNVIFDHKTEQGNSKAYALTRLQREAPELYADVVDGKLSVNAAAIKAGFRKKPTALESAMRLLPHLSHADWQHLCLQRSLLAQAKRGRAGQR